jgi:branched-chain amino acid transport system permease protein
MTDLRIDEPTIVQPEPRRGTLSRILVALLVIALIVPPFVTNPLELTKLSRLVVLVLAVLGVNLLTGYTGLISLGHGVFVGVGAFAMANFIDWGISLYLAGLLATLFTGVVGLLLGLPALRIKGIYLALVTFGIALAFGPFARRLGTWTGGPSGRNVNNDAFVPPSFLGLDDHVHIWRYAVCLVVVGLWFWLVRNLVNSRMGRALRTVRDNEAAAATFGISIYNAKAGALAISSAMAGTAGVMQAILSPYIGFSDFDAFLSLRLYAAAVIGGLGTLTGAI